MSSVSQASSFHPAAATFEATLPPKSSHAAKTPQKTEQAPKTDTVSISPEAHLMRSKSYSPAEEGQETSLNKNLEKAQGQM